MRTDTAWLFKTRPRYLLSLLGITCVSIAANPLFTLPSSVISNGGGLTTSTNYSTYSTLGQLTIGSFSSSSYQIQAHALLTLDSDSDGFPDSEDNCQSIANVDQLNTDSDMFGNACDTDDDNDGLSDLAEASLGTDPLVADTDGDGLTDNVDPNPLTPNADGDLAPYGSPDGIINTADLLIAGQIITGIITPTAQDIIHADINADGIIDLSDLILIEKLVLSPSF